MPVKQRKFQVSSVILLITGLLSFYSKTSMNRQRINVRTNNGNYKIWGHPARIIKARHTDDKGVEHESILLVDGWWIISRNFHYVGLCLHFSPVSYLTFMYFTSHCCFSTGLKEITSVAKTNTENTGKNIAGRYLIKLFPEYIDMKFWICSKQERKVTV